MRTVFAVLLAAGAAQAAQAAEDAHAHHRPATAKPAVDPHAEHRPPAPAGAVPAPSLDFAADKVFGTDVMAAARAALSHEHGARVFSKVMVDELEFSSHRGKDGYAWSAEVWLGGDLNRGKMKTEGEGARGLQDVEVQALYSRAIGPYFDIQAGLRHDFEPGPSRSYAVFGLEGLAPYWFEVESAAYVSEKGDILGRIEASYDQLITQRLAVEPSGEVNFALQDIPDRNLSGGFTDLEVGVRLRYEFRREFAPYVGLSYERKLGGTADLTRAAGERAGETRLVAGIRMWF